MHTKATIGLCLAFLTILSVLHMLEPEFNPPHFISEYQLGRFGWLMSLAFFCPGWASLALFGSPIVFTLVSMGFVRDETTQRPRDP